MKKTKKKVLNTLQKTGKKQKKKRKISQTKKKGREKKRENKTKKRGQWKFVKPNYTQRCKYLTNEGKVAGLREPRRTRRHYEVKPGHRGEIEKEIDR